MERCSNHSIEVYGSSDNKYIVSVKDYLPTCTCMDFMMKRNKARSKKPHVVFKTPWCKHLEAQFNRLCRWQGEPLIEGLCDRCCSPTEVIEDKIP